MTLTPSSTTPHVLRLTRTDVPDSFVLLYVPPSGKKPLDVRIKGTDGEDPYVVSLKHNRISQLKAPNSPLSDEEWQDVVATVLFDHASATADANIEAVALVESQESLSIHVRKHVQGITQRLGTIKLSYKENEEIWPFDWCGIAAEQRSSLQLALDRANRRAAILEETIKGLKTQLGDFVTAKEMDEAELLEKFKRLLNEKKLKIREQQNIIRAVANNPVATANEENQVQVKEEPMDDDAATGIEKVTSLLQNSPRHEDFIHNQRTNIGPSINARGHPSTRSYAARGENRTIKRKHRDTEEDDLFDNTNRMDVEKGPASASRMIHSPQDATDSELEEDRQTTDDSDTADEIDEDENWDVEAPLMKAARNSKINQEVPAIRQVQGRRTGKKPDVSSNFVFENGDLEELPPPRTLPFANKRRTRATQPEPPVDGNDDETDDEL